MHRVAVLYSCFFVCQLGLIQTLYLLTMSYYSKYIVVSMVTDCRQTKHIASDSKQCLHYQ